jgi:hypothetical protein
MAVSMYDIAIPGTVRILKHMSAIIDKAAAHCGPRKIDPAVVVGYRLAANMFPFSRQIQIMTDQAKGMAARLSGQDVPSYPDVETTFDELKARLAKTIAFLNGISPAQLEGSETRDIMLKGGGVEFRFKGLAYVTDFFLPNFYFHGATAYDILRHIGVELGKRDFIG